MTMPLYIGQKFGELISNNTRVYEARLCAEGTKLCKHAYFATEWAWPGELTLCFAIHFLVPVIIGDISS